MNFFEHQAAARKSTVRLVVLVAVAALVLYGALAYLLLTDARGSQQRAEKKRPDGRFVEGCAQRTIRGTDRAFRGRAGCACTPR